MEVSLPRNVMTVYWPPHYSPNQYSQQAHTVTFEPWPIGTASAAGVSHLIQITVFFFSALSCLSRVANQVRTFRGPGKRELSLIKGDLLIRPTRRRPTKRPSVKPTRWTRLMSAQLVSLLFGVKRRREEEQQKWKKVKEEKSNFELTRMV